MATEAEKPEDISVIMKIKEEIKELDCSHFDGTVSKASLGELQKVEDEHSAPADTVGYSTKTEVLEVAADDKDNGNHVLESKVGHSEGESFLISPSVANIASEETCRTSGACEDKEKSILVENEVENAMQLGEQNSTSTSMENGRVEEETANSASEMENVEECSAEKFPSIPITSPSIEQNEQEGKTEGGKYEVMEEKKLIENSEAVHDEQTLEAICATESVQEEEVLTDSKKDEVEGKTSGEDPSLQSREEIDQRIQETPDQNNEADSPDSIKESLCNDDKSAGDVQIMEVSTENNKELLACSNGEVDDKNWDSQKIPNKQEVQKTNSEEVTEINERDKSSNLVGTEEINNDEKAEDEIPQASHKLDIPFETTATEEMRSLKAEPEKREADNSKEEMSKGLETADSNEYIDKTIIQEDEIIKSQSTVTFVEEKVQSSQEAEKAEEKHETEVFAGREVEEASKETEEQIINENDVVKDHCTESTVEEAVNQSNQEDEKAGKEFEKEDCTGTKTTIANEDNNITASEDSDPIKDRCTVSVGEETVGEGSYEDEEAKKAKIEVIPHDLQVCKELETTEAGEDTVKESADEDGAVTDFSVKAIEGVTTTEEYIEKTASEDNNDVKDHSTVSVEEETVKENSQEDEEVKKPEVEVLKGIEINDATENIKKQIIDDIEETTKENSQEDEACEELQATDASVGTVKESVEEHAAVTDIGAVAIEETTTTGEHIQKMASEDNNVVKDHCTVSVGEEMAKESSDEDEEAKNPKVEVFEGLDTNGASDETAKHILEDGVATYLSTASVDEEAIKESSKEDEVHEKTEEVGEAKVTEEHIVKEEIAAAGEETVGSSQEDEVCKELETTGPSEDAIKESVEEHGAVTDICEVAIGEVTTIEDSQEELKEAKLQGEVEESDPISKELKTTDCTQNTETEMNNEDPIKSPITSVITEASGEEIQKELNEKLAGSSLESLVPEVSEEHIAGDGAEKEKIISDKLETESATNFSEPICLNEAEPEGLKLIDASHLPSEEMSTEPIEANGTSLQALHHEEVKHEENSNSDENTLKTENPDADEAKDEMKYNMTCVVPGPESDDHETDITSGTETTGIMFPPTNESEKLQETLTLSSKQQDPELVEANEKIKDETPMEDEIQDEKPEIPIVAQTKEESSMQKEETCKSEETSSQSESMGKENPNEELQKEDEKIQNPPEPKDVDTFLQVTCNTSSLVMQKENPETSDKEETITDEIHETNEMDFSEIVKVGDEEVLEKSSQKDNLQVDKQERCIDLVLEELETVDSTKYDEKIISDKGEEPEKKPEESFKEETLGGESSEIDHTRETELQKEVENVTDLASTQQNLKQVDSCEKIESVVIDDSDKHKDDSSIPSLEPRVEINEEDEEEAHKATEATGVSKSIETDHEETDGLAASGLMQKSEMECVNLEEIDPAKKLKCGDEVEEAVKNLEEERKGGESSEIDRTRETELKDEVENFSDLASTHENLKPADASEKIQSAETDGSYKHEGESSMPNLKQREINQEDGQEEAQVIEGTEESKSPETTTLDHDKADGLAASGMIQTIEMECVNPEAIDPAEKLRGASESVAENQSHVTLDETEKEGKTIKDQNTESNEDHINGQITREEEMESKKLEETVPTLEPEELNHEVNYARETTKNCITTEKVPGDVEKAGESEEIEKQIIEEDVASKELDAVCIRDEAVKEVTDCSVVPSEQNIEVTDSNDNIEIPKKEDSEKLLEVSTLKSEVFEENDKETDDSSGVLKPEPVIVATEETSSPEIEPEVEKIVLASGIGSEEKSLERVETTEIGLMNDEDKNAKVEKKYELVSQPPITENGSVKLEEKFELVSQPPITEDGNQNQEDVIVEKLDADKFEEEIKDEQVIESDHAADQLPTSEKPEEKLQESSALVSETQELEVSATEKIKDNPTIEGASDILHNPEIETMVDQNVEADKADTQELRVPAEIREISVVVQLEDGVQDKKNMDALTVTNTEEATSPHKEEECKELVPDMGLEDVVETPNAKAMKEGENLEIAPNFVPGENVSESKDVASILDSKETAELTEPREDSKNDNMKDYRSTETGETKEESESEGLGKCITNAGEETETDGASVNTVKDVLDESSTEVNKGDELTISCDTTENDNPNKENSEEVNLSAKFESAEVKTPKENENDSSIIHSSVEETLVGKVGGECDEASNLESVNLKESLESVSEAQIYEIFFDIKQNEANQTMMKEVSNEEVHAGLETIGTNERNEKEIPGEEGSVEEPHPISVEEEPVKENHQEDHKGEQFREATTKSGPGESSNELEAEEDHTGKTNEAPETIMNEIVNEEIRGLENAGASEANEEPITEEKQAAKNPYEKWENKIKEEATKLDLEDQYHEVPSRDCTTENEEILQGLQNAGPIEINEELISEQEEAVTNPYEKWEKQIKEAASKLDLEDQIHEPPCKDHTTENEEILPVETNSETSVPTETRETMIVKDVEGPNENLRDPLATNAPCKEAPKEETGDMVVEVSALVPDETAPKCQLEVDNLKNSTSELASKPTVITEDVPLKDEGVPTKVDASVLTEASEEAIREEKNKATCDEGRHIAKQELAEVGPLTEGSEGQHIKDEAPEEEILKKETGKMLDEAHIQEKERENEDMKIQIPKQEENQVFIAAEQATADGSIMAGTEKSSKTSDSVVVEQGQQVHESEKTETTKLEDADSFNEKLGNLPNVQIGVKDFLETEATMKLAEDDEIPQSVEKIEKPIDTTNEEQGQREVTLNENTEANISTGSTDTPSFPEDLSGTILERTNIEVQKPREISEIEPEFKGAECEEESNNEPKPSDSDKISLSELIQRPKKEPPVEESESLANKELLETKVPPTFQVEEEAKEEEEKNEEEEEEDEHKKTDSGSDAPVMVEASTDVDVKTIPSPKKSHNILSGVGSKVKHSIIKVKKAITGKSSSQHKSTSPKKEKENGSTATLKTVG